MYFLRACIFIIAIFFTIDTTCQVIEDEPEKLIPSVTKRQFSLQVDGSSAVSIYYFNASFEFLHCYKYIKMGARIDFGYLSNTLYSSSDNRVLLAGAYYIVLFGKERHFFENNLGLIYGPNATEFPLPTTMVGYRFQTKGILYFRSGLSLPFGLYFGLGVHL